MTTVTLSIETGRYHVVDAPDQYRGDRWGARHFLHSVGYSFDTADAMLDKAVETL